MGDPFADLIPNRLAKDDPFADLVPQPRSLVAEVPLQMLGGVRDAAVQFGKTISSTAQNLDPGLGGVHLGADGVRFVSSDELARIRETEPLLPLPEVAEPSRAAGAVTRGVAQFATGFVPFLRAGKALGVESAATKAAQRFGTKAETIGKVVNAEAAAVAADQTVFDPYSGRLSNLVQEHPSLANPLTEYLAADPNDTESTARFKVALEGLGLGALTAGIIETARAGYRRVRPVRAPALESASPVTTGKEQSADPFADLVPANKQPQSIPVPPVAPVDPARILERGSEADAVRIGRLRTSQDIRAALDATASEYRGRIDEARRGQIGSDEVRKLAGHLGMTEEQLLTRRKGQAFNAEEALASRRILLGSTRDLVGSAKAAVGGSDDAKASFLESMARQVAIQEQVAGMTAEAGRALRQFQIAATASEQAKAVKAIIASAGGHTKVDEIAEAVAALDSPEGVAKFARGIHKAKTSDQLLELWINSLLSGPATHAVNALSNSITALWSIPEHALASGISLVRGGDRNIYGRETLSRMFGMVQGARDGVKLAARAFITEEPSDALTKIEFQKYRTIPSLTLNKGKPKKLWQGIPVPFTGEVQLGGKQVRIPGRLLQASDEFFKSIGYRMELNALAMRTGLQKGLKGEALARHVADTLNSPPPQLRSEALEAARYQTFTRNLGEMGRSMQRLAQSHPAVRLIMPFVRTPANLMKYAIERTPAGPLMEEVREHLKAGGARRDLAIARMTLGSSIGAVVASLAAEGHVTGGGPIDPRARSTLLNTGWQPYSVRVGDTYYAFNRLDPFGTVLGLAADYSDISGSMSDKEAEEVAAEIAAAVSRNLASRTWLRSMSGLLDALENPEREGGQFTRQLAGTIIPTGVAQFAKAEDPVFRDARTLLDAIKARVPGYSQELPARLNVWGEPIVASGGLGPDVMSPIRTSVRTNDPVAEEVQRLGLNLSLPSRYLGGTELTPDQFARLVAASGSRAKAHIAALIRSERYQRLDSEKQKAAILRLVSEARAHGRKAAFAFDRLTEPTNPSHKARSPG